MNNVIGILLAGGQSRRMGKDKRFLKTQSGDTFLEHGKKLLSTICQGGVYVSDPQHIADRCSGLGPLEGVRSVFNYLLNEGVAIDEKMFLIIPIDQPYLTQKSLENLLNTLRMNHTISAVNFKHHPIPLAIRGSKRILEALNVSINQCPTGGFQDWLKAMPIEEIVCEDRCEMMNVNTPQEYQLYESQTI